MRRLMICLVMGASFCAGGCNFFQDTNPEPAWTQQRWQDVKEENAIRVAGEDKTPKSTTWTVVFAVPDAIWSGVGRVWDYAWHNTPREWANDLFGKVPDRRREAIFKFDDKEFGRKPPYTTYYAHMAETDDAFTVRAAALRALNRSRDRQAVPIYIHALDDTHELVRLEAAKALANVPDDRAVPALLRHLEGRLEVPAQGGGARVEEENRDVRIACADALRNFPNVQAAQALIRVLQDRDFGVAWQARQSLLLITGRDLQFDQAAWLNYLTTAAKPFG